MAADIKEIADALVHPVVPIIAEKTVDEKHTKKQFRSRSQDQAQASPRVLREFKPSYPDTFKFKKIGSRIRGNLVRHKTITFEQGPRELIVLKTRDGLRTVWLNTQLQTVINEAMDEGALKVGTEIEIELIGYKQSGRDSRYCYEEYKVSLE